jgi:hypothetical protein
VSAYESRKWQLYCNSTELHATAASAFFDPPAAAEFSTSLPELRKLAKAAGWTHAPSPYGRRHARDYCPEHKPGEAATAAGEAGS